MTECVVTCDKCRTETGQPMRWRWLCEICAEDCQETHRRQTGHCAELRITVEPDLSRLIAQANQGLGRWK